MKRRRSLTEYAMALLLLLPAMCPRLRAQGPDTTRWIDTLTAEWRFDVRFYLKRGVLESLGALADTAQTEHIRCLLGRMDASELYTDLIYQPQALYSSPVNAGAEACPAATLLEWHNHPVQWGQAAVGFCYFSQTDLADAQKPRVGRVIGHLVHVNATTYCWWSTAQIDAHIRRFSARELLRPIKGQTSW